MTQRPDAASTTQLVDPRHSQPAPPFPRQEQVLPGGEGAMAPKPDAGEQSYVGGTGRLAGLVSVVTGADSGIGRAVAIAFAREGADVVVSYLDEEDDAKETCRFVEEAGRKAVAIPGDIGDAAHCRSIVDRAVREFGRIDVLVNNAAHQQTFSSIEEIPDGVWRRTWATNVDAMFYLCRAAVPHMAPGASIVNTASVEAFSPDPTLLAYAATKAAIVNFTRGLAKMLGPNGIRVNCVCPGPVWTPLIPASMSPDKASTFGQNSPLGRPAQPVELAGVYVFLASPEASYVNGSAYGVHGGGKDMP